MRCKHLDCRDVIPAGRVDGWCSDWCAKDAKPVWTDRAIETAKAAVNAGLTPADATLCAQCRRRLPPRSGKRGRPRVTCSDFCHGERQRRQANDLKAHKRAVLRTDPATIGRGRDKEIEPALLGARDEDGVASDAQVFSVSRPPQESILDEAAREFRRWEALVARYDGHPPEHVHTAYMRYLKWVSDVA